MKNFLYYWLPVFVYAGLIFYFSSFPEIPSIIIEIIPETLIWHMIEYAIFSILLFRAFINSKNTNFRKNAIYLAIAITIFYGITDEIHQYFVPERTISLFDVIGDSVGSFIILTKKVFDKHKLYFKRQS